MMMSTAQSLNFPQAPVNDVTFTKTDQQGRSHARLDFSNHPMGDQIGMFMHAIKRPDCMVDMLTLAHCAIDNHGATNSSPNTPICIPTFTVIWGSFASHMCSSIRYRKILKMLRELTELCGKWGAGARCIADALEANTYRLPVPPNIPPLGLTFPVIRGSFSYKVSYSIQNTVKYWKCCPNCRK